MNRFTKLSSAFLFAAYTTVSVFACGGSAPFLVPADTELKTWVAPETDELVQDDTKSRKKNKKSDEDEYKDYEDEE